MHFTQKKKKLRRSPKTCHKNIDNEFYTTLGIVIDKKQNWKTHLDFLECLL